MSGRLWVLSLHQYYTALRNNEKLETSAPTEYVLYNTPNIPIIYLFLIGIQTLRVGIVLP